MEHQNNNACLCLQCIMGKDVFQKHQKDLMEKYGWVVHYVFDQNPYNIHTHGLPQNFGHPDFQIYANLNQQTAHNILINLVERVKAGEKFKTGVSYSHLISNYNVKFELAKENDRTVMRIIFPSKDGKFEGEFYESQLEGIININ